MYIYQSHLNALFSSANELADEELICETCGERDNLLGYATTMEELKDLLSDRGYDIKECWIQNFLRSMEKRYNAAENH